MNKVTASILLAAAYLAVYFTVASTWPHRLLGVQVDLLPSLMVFTALTLDLPAVFCLAVVGGGFFDAFSFNPLGVSTVSLLVAGYTLHFCRELVVRNQVVTQMICGATATLAIPALSLLLLHAGLFEPARPGNGLSLDTAPALEAGAILPSLAQPAPLVALASLSQGLILVAAGAVLAPLVFALLDRLMRALEHPVAHPSWFRSDREVKHGRYL